MIYEVDEALRAMVRRDALPGSDVEVVFDAPTKDWASRRNTPTVDIYLYDIRAVRGAGVIVIAAGVTGAARLAGVAASTGTAADWAAALAGSTLTQLVPDEHLTPDGAATIRLEKEDSADG